MAECEATMGEPAVDDLVRRIRAGEAWAVGRAISLVERNDPVAALLLDRLPRSTGCQVIGLTGPPGVGKSTTTGALIAAYRGRGRRVAVLAVDPSSPLTGGALLGDRIRMRDHAMDPEVFIRSMASRGHLGGLAVAVPPALRIIAAAGYGIVLLETVGIGQSEVDIAALADTTVVIGSPGQGDELQAVKAGIMEIGDVFVINKADQAGADLAVRQLRQGLSYQLRGLPAGAWRPPVVTACSIKGDVAQLVEAAERHWEWLRSSGELDSRRATRMARELESLVVASVVEILRTGDGAAAVRGSAQRVQDSEETLEQVVRQLRALVRQRL